MRSLPAALAGCCLALAACQDDGSAFDYATMGATTAGSGDEAEASGGSAGSSESATDSEDDSGGEGAETGESGPILDVGGTGETGSNLDSCTAVDLLFVIDNSPSMLEYQQQLNTAFPSFVDAIYDTLDED